ncbi:MAG: hypothetical protein IAE83_00595 [Anaerolinea sp.]|nr:hypothetical protein [Anaerolinea sp.]
MKHLKTIARITCSVIGIVLSIFTAIVVFLWLSRKLDFDVLHLLLSTLAAGFLYLAGKLRADRKVADLKKALFNDAEGERRYLNLVLKDFEERRGVLEFVTLSGKTEETIPFFDEWGYSELIDKGKVSSPSNQDKIPLRNIEEALDRHSRFVLIGSPGAGKTTTLRYIARKYAIARLDNTVYSPLPLLLYLPQWQNKTPITEFISSHWLFSTDIMGLLKAGDVILFLDGLNEMGAGGAQKTHLLNT